MRVSELAKELNTTTEIILAKLRAFKLKAKDGEQELNSFVLSVLRREIISKGVKVAPMVSKTPFKALAEPKEFKTSIAPEKLKKEVKETKVKTKPASIDVRTNNATVSKKKDVEILATSRGIASREVSKAKKSETPSVLLSGAPKVKPKLTKSASVKKTVSPVPPVALPVVPEIPVQKARPKLSDAPFVSVKPLPKRKKRPSSGFFKEPVKETPKLDKELRPEAPKTESPAPTISLVDKESSSGLLGEEKISAPLTQSAVEEKIFDPRSLLPPLEVKIPIAVKDFAVKLQQKQGVVLKKLMEMGIFANINQHLNEEAIRTIAAGFGYSIIKTKTQEEQLIDVHKTLEEDPQFLKSRAPVVTFMGHVDHGKTSLLDKIRKTKIADEEHGGITQHIGAYTVNYPKGKITFLDTPGHEAFTAMRARGAHITDVVVLVVAADEGIMPQTIEALDHARAAGVPIVIALNKIDKPNADSDRVKKQLADRDLLPEDWGGKTIVVGVSAITGEGIDRLLEMILLEAELLELKANYEKKASGIVVDAHMSQGKGALATVIVQNGTLQEGDVIVVGSLFGRIRAMFDDREKPVKEAGPSMAAEILGLPGVPEAGDVFYVVESEKQAREITLQRQEQTKAQKMQATSKITLEDLYAQIQAGKIKELSVIMKTDVQGSMEALIDSLKKIPSDEVQVKFIHTGIGDINASDVILADASNAIIIGFQVSVDARAKQELEKHPVDVRTYRIIYDAVNDIRNALEGLLEPKTKKKFLSRIEVRQVFKLSKSGMVAGCFVQKGKVIRKANVDILRNGQVVFSGSIGSLKRFKDDVREVAEGMECGISIHNFDKVEPGDTIEAYELEKIARKL